MPKGNQIVFLILSTTLLYGSFPDTTDSLSQKTFGDVGYVKVTSDSLGTPIYVDGVHVGSTPLIQPIPVIHGIHEISYLPPEYDRSALNTGIFEAIKRVYVPPGDTIQVMFYYESQFDQIRAIQREQTLGHYVGMTMLGMVLFLLWQITG